MKVVDIASEIYSELARPKELSVPPVAFWLRSNIGDLNNRINQDFYIDSATLEINRSTVDASGNEVVVEIGEEEKAIFKKMYIIHYYGVQIRAALGAASTDTWVEIQSDGTSVRRINKVEQGRQYQFIKMSETEALEKAINAYKMRAAEPIQVAGDDTVEGNYGTDDYVRTHSNL